MSAWVCDWSGGVGCAFFFFQAEDGIRDLTVTGVQTCALPISVLGTRFSRIITARAAFLALGLVALALLTLGRDRAVGSRWWQALAALAGGGVLDRKSVV